MMSHWSLKSKIIFAFSIVAMNLAGVGAVGFYGLQQVIHNFSHVAKINFGNYIALTTVRGGQKDLVIPVISLTGTHASKEDVARAQDLIIEAKKTIEAGKKNYLAIGFAPGEDGLWERVNQSLIPIIEQSQKLIDLSATGNKADEVIRDKIVATQYADARKEFRDSLELLLKFQSNESSKWVNAAEGSASTANFFSFIIVGLGFLLAIGIGFFFSRSLSKTLNQLADNMLKSAESVAGSSQEVSAAGTELSSSTTEQSAALQETVASIEEVSAMVQKNAENSTRSQSVSSQSQTAVMKGKQTVESMIIAIDDINHSNNEIMQQIETSNQQISEIVKVIAEIGNKTKVINDIVFQTKLLSFNASVEAARAGEHGKGFAVVAEEVGNLAQMSGNAAKEISQMLEGSIRKVESIVNDTKSKVEKLVVSGKQKVEVGTRTARQCGEVLDEIVKNVTEVNQRVSEITVASHEQSQGVQEINKAMNQMDQLTHQNATASQQVAAASELLSSEAQALRNLIQDLVKTVQGGGVQELNRNPYSAQRKNNLVRLPARKTQVAAKSLPKSKPLQAPLKKAVGAEHLPSHDDSRFEDV